MRIEEWAVNDYRHIKIVVNSLAFGNTYMHMHVCSIVELSHTHFKVYFNVPKKEEGLFAPHQRAAADCDCAMRDAAEHAAVLIISPVARRHTTELRS